MNDDLPAQVRTTVESICELGCERVNEIIAELESGQRVHETAELSSIDKQTVLHELKAIMAIYNRTHIW